MKNRCRGFCAAAVVSLPDAQPNAAARIAIALIAARVANGVPARLTRCRVTYAYCILGRRVLLIARCWMATGDVVVYEFTRGQGASLMARLTRADGGRGRLPPLTEDARRLQGWLASAASYVAHYICALAAWRDVESLFAPDDSVLPRLRGYGRRDISLATMRLPFFRRAVRLRSPQARPLGLFAHQPAIIYQRMPARLRGSEVARLSLPTSGCFHMRRCCTARRRDAPFLQRILRCLFYRLRSWGDKTIYAGAFCPRTVPAAGSIYSALAHIQKSPYFIIATWGLLWPGCFIEMPCSSALRRAAIPSRCGCWFRLSADIHRAAA